MQSEKPIGEQLDFKPSLRPSRTRLAGAHVALRPVDAARDAESLFAASHPPDEGEGLWTYLPTGPYPDAAELRAWAESAQSSEDPLYYTILKLPEERPSGIASYLRIVPEHGSIEIGHVWFGVELQRTTGATEAIYLLARHAFDELGYRRLEWKCNALNAASRRAAERFGFRYEGVFLQHMVVKGRNRDTAWYAITDREWPAVRQGFEGWLRRENFDADGAQRRSLHELIEEARR